MRKNKSFNKVSFITQLQYSKNYTILNISITITKQTCFPLSPPASPPLPPKQLAGTSPSPRPRTTPSPTALKLPPRAQAGNGATFHHRTGDTPLQASRLLALLMFTCITHTGLIFEPGSLARKSWRTEICDGYVNATLGRWRDEWIDWMGWRRRWRSRVGHLYDS